MCVVTEDWTWCIMERIKSDHQCKRKVQLTWWLTSGPTCEGCRPVSATCFKEVIGGWRSFIIYTVTLLQDPLQGNGWVSMFPWQWMHMQQSQRFLEAVFSVQSNQRLYKENLQDKLVDSWQLRQLWAVRWSPASNDISMRAEESPLLGTITEEQLIKTVTDLRLSMCYSDLLWRLAKLLIVTCSYEL
jgi:hypothetical protein